MESWLKVKTVDNEITKEKSKAPLVHLGDHTAESSPTSTERREENESKWK